MFGGGEDWHASAGRHYAAGRLDEALADAWRAHAADPDTLAIKNRLVNLLCDTPDPDVAGRRDTIALLVEDADVDPDRVARAAWRCVNGDTGVLDRVANDPAGAAGLIEGDALSLRLLGEVLVSSYEAEAPLTALRRWLLLSERWRDFPRTVAALAGQAMRNGGAWLLDAEEQAALAATGAAEMRAAYHPAPEAAGAGGRFSNRVTQMVADQYHHWPYPTWTRATASIAGARLAERIARIDPEGIAIIPDAPEVLIAGCGTCHEVALIGRGYPDARLTGIDISEGSLAYGRPRLAALGIDADLRVLDLRRVSELGKRFDAIFCSGVLSCLDDPEEGWAALVDALKPGGVLRVMVYSVLARLPVQAWRAMIADLQGQPLSADLLRAIRRRLIERDASALLSRDFYSLSGVHDLLIPEQEECFDVPRIARVREALGLELLCFTLPTPRIEAQYRAEFPEDPRFRNLANLSAFELRNPGTFVGMYNLMFCKPAN